MAFKQKFKCVCQRWMEHRHCQFEIILNMQFSFKIRQHTHAHSTSTILQMFRDHFLAFHHFLLWAILLYTQRMKKEKKKKRKNNKTNTIKNAIHFTFIAVIRYILLLYVIDRLGIATTVFCLSWHMHVLPNRILYLFNRKPISISKKTMTTFTFHLWSNTYKLYCMKITEYLNKLKTFYRKKCHRSKILKENMYIVHVSEMMPEIQMCGCTYRLGAEEKKKLIFNKLGQ